MGVETFPGPASPAEYGSWAQRWREWRRATLASVHYSGAVYDSELLWTQTMFMQVGRPRAFAVPRALTFYNLRQPQMMAHERFFWSNDSRAYTVKRYVDFVTEQYGGIDAVLIWASYPNIGVGACRPACSMLR